MAHIDLSQRVNPGVARFEVPMHGGPAAASA